jgi:hypothetical protein
MGLGSRVRQWRGVVHKYAPINSNTRCGSACGYCVFLQRRSSEGYGGECPLPFPPDIDGCRTLVAGRLPLPRGRRDGRVRSLSCCGGGGGGSGNELLPAIRPNQPRRVMWTPSKKRSWCARDRVMCATSQSHSRRIVECLLDMDIPAVLQRYSAAG